MNPFNRPQGKPVSFGRKLMMGAVAGELFIAIFPFTQPDGPLSFGLVMTMLVASLAGLVLFGVGWYLDRRSH